MEMNIFEKVKNWFVVKNNLQISKKPKQELVYGKYHRCRIAIRRFSSNNTIILFSGYKTMNSDTTFIVSSYYIHRNKIEGSDVSPIIRNRMDKWYEN
jgi:hypothetical protein